MTSRQYYYGHIFADPQDAEHGLHLLREATSTSPPTAAKTYTEVQTPHSDYHDLWIDPKDHLPDGERQRRRRRSVTFNGGRTWSVARQPADGAVLRGRPPTTASRTASTDRSRTTRPSRLRAGPTAPASPTTDWHPVGGGESGYLAPTPSNPPVVFGGSYFGLMTRYDERTGQTRNVTDLARLQRRPDGRGRELPLPVDLPDHRVAARRQHAVRRRAGGVPIDQRRTELGNDQPRPHAQRQGEAEGRPARGYYSTIFTIAESKREKGVIWTGSDDGLVQLTRNGGRDWQNVTPPALQPFTRVNIIEASPHDAGTAYVAVEPLSARRLPAVTSSRPPTTASRWQADRVGHPRAQLRPHGSRGSDASGICCSPAPRPASTTRSTAARGGNRSSSICRWCRSPTSRSRTAISSRRHRAARSGCSTTSTPLHDHRRDGGDGGRAPRSRRATRCAPRRAGFGRGAGRRRAEPRRPAPIITYCAERAPRR